MGFWDTLSGLIRVANDNNSQRSRMNVAKIVLVCCNSVLLRSVVYA